MKHINEILAAAIPRRQPARKPRMPKPVHLNAVQRAIESSRKLPDVDRENLQLICAQAFLAFKTAEHCSENWRCMADAMNIAEALCELGICSDEDSRYRVTSGQAALTAVVTRKRGGGNWTLRVAEIAAIDEALWLHSVQMEHCSLGEYERAVKRVAERTRQALAGNAGNGVQVVEVRP